MSDELLSKLDAVTDRDSFFEFVRALVKDREASVAAEDANPSSPYGPDAGGWENASIEDFLESALAWAIDSELSADPSWKSFARILVAGKHYE